MPDPLSPEEARERLDWAATSLHPVDAILATVNALAALVDWPKLLEAGERAGKVAKMRGDVEFNPAYWCLTARRVVTDVTLTSISPTGDPKAERVIRTSARIRQLTK